MKRPHDSPPAFDAEGALPGACRPAAPRTVEDLFHEFSGPLKRYGVRLGFLPEAAEEAVQEGFLRLQGAFVRHEPVHNPGAFLHTVVRRLLIDTARASGRFDSYVARQKPAPRLGDGANSPDAAGLFRLADAVLSPRENEVVTLRRHGRSYQQISSELGISRGTVGALMSRALVKIRHLARGSA